MSLLVTNRPSLPRTSILMVGGTRSHISPVAKV